MAIRQNIPIKLYLLLVLMLVAILITGIYGIRELQILNQITETIYADHSIISDEQYKISAEIYQNARRNSYLFLSLSLAFCILLGVYVIKNVKNLIKNLKLSNAKIMQSEGEFHELIKYAGDAIFLTDMTYQINAVNDSACKLLNYSSEELQNMKIFELMTADDQKTFDSRVKIIHTEGGSLHERKFIKKDGNFVETEVNVRPIEGIGYIAIIRDITERKEAEIKIRESEERFKSIITVSNTGGWEYDSNSDFVWYSPEYFLMLGRKQSDYDTSGGGNLMDVWSDLLHPEDKERAINHFAEYLENGSVGTYESYFRMLHANGSWVWIWSRGQTLRDAQGKLTSMTVGTHIDITELKNAETKIRESEERYKSIITVSNTGAWEYHTDTDFLWCSPEYFLMLGRKQSDYDFSGKVNLQETWINLLHPEDRERAINHFAEYLKNGSIGTYESYFRMLHADGSWVWIWSRGQTLRDAQGELTTLTVGTHIDITERKRIEKDLIESEVRFREVLENSISASYKRNLHTNTYDYLSPVFKKIAGYTQEELNTLPLETVVGLMHPDDIQGVVDGISKAINELNGLENALEYRFKHKENDEYRWLKDEFVVMQDTQGQADSLIGSVSDITESKKAEAIIKEQAEIFTAIIENANEAIWLLSPDMTVLQFNKTFKERLRLNGGKEINLGDNFKDFLYSGKEDAFMAMFNDALSGNYPENEFSQNNIHGELFWIRTRMYPVYDTHKKLIGVTILTENITERKLMESERQKMVNEILQRNRDLEQFAYIVSHNLRAPVTNIMGISDYMLSPEIEEEEKEEMNSGLRKSVDRLDEVIKDLNNILQVKREISDKKETVRLSNLLGDIKMSIATLIEKESVNFIFDFKAIDEMVTIKNYLHSIFYNLISNSIKYRRLDVTPVIEVRSAVVENKIEITYKDNGLGIDLEKRGDQVFGLYKRFHTHVEGKGMGLYMVKTQVETLGGTISIKSEINKGVEFKIKFEIEKISN